MFGMPTYVISLKGREDRRKTFDDNWKSYDYEYVDAIDGDDLDIKKLIQDGVINDYFLSPGYFIGTRAVYGVALAQKKCWEKFLETDEERCLILEDDAINCSTDEEIYDVINELDKIKDWEILCLGKSHHEIRGHPFQDDVKLLNKTVYGQSWFGAHAYIINRKSAQKLIDNFFPITFAVDVYMEEILDNLTPEISLIRQISHLGYFKETFIKDSDTFGNYLEWGHNKHTLDIRQSCADFTIFESIELHDSVPKKAESPHDIPYQKGILKK